jgi:hypothetical protein
LRWSTSTAAQMPSTQPLRSSTSIYQLSPIQDPP